MTAATRGAALRFGSRAIVYNRAVRGWIVLVLLAAAVLLAGIGRTAITESDEAYYAEAGREMVERGDFLTPRFNYEPRFQKPILFYWMIAACYRVLGVNEFAARAGSALAGLGIALVVYGLGRRWYGETTGLRAGTIAVTSLGCAAMARASLPDMPLAFFITAATAAGLVPLAGRVPHPRRWWLLAAAMAALACLTKGPIGLVVPAVVLGPMMLFAQRQRRPSLGTLAAAAAVLAVIAIPWYAAMASTHGAGYLRGFFVGDNLERFATPRFNEPRSLLYYVPVVAAGLLPWSPLWIVAVPPIWRTLARRTMPRIETVALVLWTLAPLLLFSVSVGKQPRYVLPVLPALALALARTLEPVIAPDRPAPPVQARLLSWGVAISASFFLLMSVLVLRARPVLAAAGNSTSHLAAAVALAGAVAVALVAVSARVRLHLVPFMAAASTALVAAVQFGILARPGTDPVRQMAAHVAMHRRSAEAVAPYRAFTRNLVFYTHIQQADLYSRERLLAFLESPDRVLCVMPAEEAEALAKEGRPLRRLAEVRQFDPSTARPRTLLNPDPARDLQTIVLVANR